VRASTHSTRDARKEAVIEVPICAQPVPIVLLLVMIVESCSAGRAHCAWGGHFVTCIPCLGWLAAMVLPLIGRRLRGLVDGFH
jgi:drug/metabolite transporter superfamily protein YnfA